MCIRDSSNTFSLVDLPGGMPRDVFKDLKKVWVCGRQLHISRWDKTVDNNAETNSDDKAETNKKKRKKNVTKSSKRPKRTKIAKLRGEKKARRGATPSAYIIPGNVEN